MPRWPKKAPPIAVAKDIHMDEVIAIPSIKCKHKDLKPITLSGLFDALRLNEIKVDCKQDDSITGISVCIITTPKLVRSIDIKSADEILAFFNAAISANA